VTALALVAQALAVALLPWAFAAVAGRVTAAQLGRRGPPLAQPLDDLRRALHRRPRSLRPRALAGLVAALLAGLLAPLWAPASPLAFTGDLAAFTLLLALRHRLTTPWALASTPALAVAALACLGRDLSLSALPAGPGALAWASLVLTLGALLLALRLHRADMLAPAGALVDDRSELEVAADRAGAALVTAALAGLFAARLLAAISLSSAALQLALVLTLAAGLGALEARVALPRPRALPVRIAVAAGLAAGALALARGGP
jgi:hypothetical protein